jgi:hypothetical protein
MHFEVPSGTVEEFMEIIQRFGEEVIPQAEQIKCRSIV